MYTVEPEKKNAIARQWMKSVILQKKKKKKKKNCPEKKSLSYHYFPLTIFSLIKPLKENLIPVIFTIYIFFSLNLSCKKEDDNYFVTPFVGKGKTITTKKHTSVGKLYSFRP